MQAAYILGRQRLYRVILTNRKRGFPLYIAIATPHFRAHAALACQEAG